MSGVEQDVWPPIMPTLRAARYCSVSKWTLLRAADAGVIAPYGRRGRTLTWRRDDLDRWMRGTPTTGTSPIATPPSPSSRGPSSSNALERIRRLARGGDS